MVYIFLFLIWFTPALIAGGLGWSGIWGSGSAFAEYLIPVPVAGGVFHVPGLVISFFILKILDNQEGILSLKQGISYCCLTILLIILGLHVDIDRLYGWLFSDYEPTTSVIRFDSNALYLFCLTDAFWLYVFSLLKGARFTVISVVLAFSVFPATIAVLLGIKNVSGPSFEIGGSTNGPQRGQEVQVVYYSGTFDESAIREWLNERAYLNQPWHNPNTEHEALIFTNSLQIIKWLKFDELNSSNTIATVCSYEEDESMFFYKGEHDCFSNKKTLNQKIKSIQKEQQHNLDVSIGYWLASSTFCESYKIPSVKYKYDIAAARLCLNLKKNYSRELQRFIERFGEESPEVRKVRRRAQELQLNESE